LSIIRCGLSWRSRLSFVLPAGRNSLTTYLAPDLIYYLSWWIGMPVLICKQDTSPALAVGGSLVWALAMIGLTALLARINIRLRCRLNRIVPVLVGLFAALFSMAN